VRYGGRSVVEGKGNPRVVRQAIYEVLDNQLRDNDPPETRLTLNRLRVLGYSEEEAREMIAYVITREIYEVMQNRKFDRAGFVANLDRLPDLE
jgi:hypothetical protein